MDSLVNSLLVIEGFFPLVSQAKIMKRASNNRYYQANKELINEGKNPYASEEE